VHRRLSSKRSWNIKEEDAEDDELSIFSGHTRFVSVKTSATTKPQDATVKTYALPSSQSCPPYQTSFETAPQPPQHVMLFPAVNNWGSPVEDRRHKEGSMPLLPLDDNPQPICYPYVPSESTHQIELSTSYG
jgi:hypothetical protein